VHAIKRKIKREEMCLYLKRGVHMCRCMLAKKGMSL
jgi:hypothetical protein